MLKINSMLISNSKEKIAEEVGREDGCLFFYLKKKHD